MLQKRNGEHIEAIKIFLGVIDKLNSEFTLDLLKEMNQMQPDPTVTSDPIWDYNSR